MEATAFLKFNLPEQEVDHYHAIHGADYHYCLDQILQMFRHKLKYTELPRAVHKQLEQMDSDIRDLLYENYYRENQ